LLWANHVLGGGPPDPPAGDDSVSPAPPNAGSISTKRAVRVRCLQCFDIGYVTALVGGVAWFDRLEVYDRD
jgi:hypothetical protein